MSSLAAQLSSQTQQVAPYALLNKPTKSFLFPPSRNLPSLQSFYPLVQNALDTMVQLDPRFSAFRYDLFQLDIQEWDMLDESGRKDRRERVQDLGRLLGPWLMKEKKVEILLEWMVRALGANQHHLQVIILLFLPYHSTVYFTKLLPILPDALPSPFSFLAPLVGPRTRLTSGLLLRHMDQDSRLLKFISSIPLQLQLKGLHRVGLNFWTSFMIKYLQQHQDLHEVHRNTILSNVLGVLKMVGKSQIDLKFDIQIGCFLILATLCRKSQFSSTQLGSLVLSSFIGLNDVEIEAPKLADRNEALVHCLIIMLESQEERLIPSDTIWQKSVFKLIRLPGVSKILFSVMQSFECQKFVKSFFTTIASSNENQCYTFCLEFLVAPQFNDLAKLTQRIILESLLEHSQHIPLLNSAEMARQRHAIGITEFGAMAQSRWLAHSQLCGDDEFSVTLLAAILNRDRVARRSALEQFCRVLESGAINTPLSKPIITSLLNDNDPDLVDILFASTKFQESVLIAYNPIDILTVHASMLTKRGITCRSLFGFICGIFVDHYPDFIEVVFKDHIWPTLWVTETTIGEVHNLYETLSQSVLAKKSRWLRNLRPVKHATSNADEMNMQIRNSLSDAMSSTDVQFLVTQATSTDPSIYNGGRKLALAILTSTFLDKCDVKDILTIIHSTLDILESSNNVYCLRTGSDDSCHILQQPNGIIVVSVSMLATASQILTTFGSVISNRESMETVAIRLYRFAHLHCRLELRKVLIADLFSNIIPQNTVVPLLVRLSWGTASPDPLREAALKDVLQLLGIHARSGLVDNFQNMLPTMIVATRSENPNIRRLAIDAFELFASHSTKSTNLIGYKDLYRSHTENMTVSATAMVAYSKFILRYKDDILHNERKIVEIHSSSTGNNKTRTIVREVASFVLSLIKCHQNIAIRVILLESIAYHAAAPIDVTVDLLHELEHFSEKYEGFEVIDEYIKQLYSIFQRKDLRLDDQTAKALIQNMDAVADNGEVKRYAKHHVTETIFNVFHQCDLDVKLLLFTSIAMESSLRTRLPELNEPDVIAEVLARNVQSLQNTNPFKRARTKADSFHAAPATLISSVIEHANFRTVVPTAKLLAALFDLIEVLPVVQTSKGMNVEHLGQITLTALSKLSDNLGMSSQSISHTIRLSPIMDLMRVATDQQTCRHALLLLSKLGQYVPDQVLHNIMPIFTFMGSSILQRDDAASSKVVDQTMESILPTLVQEWNVQAKHELSPEFWEFLRIFTDALPHIPRHRITRLADWLPCVISSVCRVLIRLAEIIGPTVTLPAMVILLSRVPEGEVENAESILSTVFSYFSCEVHIKAIIDVLHHIDNSRDISRHNGERIVLCVLRALDTSEKDLQLHQASLRLLLDRLVYLVNKDHNPIMEVALESIARIISARALMQACIEHLNNESLSEYCQISLLQLLSSKAPLLNTADHVSLDALFKFLLHGPTDLQHLALAVQKLRVLSAFSDNLDDKKIITLACHVQNIISIDSKFGNVNDKITALVGEILVKFALRFGPRLIPHLNHIISFCNVHPNAAFSAQILEAIARNLPSFMSAYLVEIFTAQLQASCDFNINVLNVLCRDLSLSEIIRTITSLSGSMEAADLHTLLVLLRKKIRASSPKESAIERADIVALLLSLAESAHIDELEDDIIAVMVKLTLKLSENTFKPMFLGLLDWQRRGNLTCVPFSRRKTFIFKLFLSLLNTLQGIVLKYMSFLLPLLLDSLNEAAALKILTMSFSFDRDGHFWTPIRLSDISKALLAHAGACRDIDRPHFLDVLGCAAERGSEDMLKNLNAELLRFLRSENETTRIFGISALVEIWTRAGNSSTTLVSMIIPYLAEALQDESSAVQSSAESLAKILEDLTGETREQWLE